MLCVCVLRSTETCECRVREGAIGRFFPSIIKSVIQGSSEFSVCVCWGLSHTDNWQKSPPSTKYMQIFATNTVNCARPKTQAASKSAYFFLCFDRITYDRAQISLITDVKRIFVCPSVSLDVFLCCNPKIRWCGLSATLPRNKKVVQGELIIFV